MNEIINNETSQIDSGLDYEIDDKIEKQNVDCLFPASFNPIHNGHINIIKLAALFYRKVYVVVAENENKNYRVFLKQRYDITKRVIENLMLPNVQILKLDYGKSIPKLAKELQVDVIIRGIKTKNVNSYENILADSYQEQNKDLMFHYISFDDQKITSSMIRELIAHDEDISELVPAQFSKEIYDIWKQVS